MKRLSLLMLWMLWSCQSTLEDPDKLFAALANNDLALLEEYGRIAPRLVNQTNSEGFTPLQIAVENNQPQFLVWLLENGADPNLTTPEGKNSYQLAVEKGNKDLVAPIHHYQYLDWKARKEPYTDEALQYAIANDNQQIVKDFLEKKNYLPDYTYPDTGVPILVDAVFNDAHLVVEYLLKQNADPNIRFDTRPVLSIAAMFGQLEIAKSLLEAGADPNATDGPLTTPLMFAAEEGHAQVVQLLIENGSNPSLKDLNGETAYDKAVNNSRIDVVRLF